MAKYLRKAANIKDRNQNKQKNRNPEETDTMPWRRGAGRCLTINMNLLKEVKEYMYPRSKNKNASGEKNGREQKIPWWKLDVKNISQKG